MAYVTEGWEVVDEPEEGEWVLSPATVELTAEWVEDSPEEVEEVVLAEYDTGGRDVEYRVVKERQGHWSWSRGGVEWPECPAEPLAQWAEEGAHELVWGYTLIAPATDVDKAAMAEEKAEDALYDVAAAQAASAIMLLVQALAPYLPDATLLALNGLLAEPADGVEYSEGAAALVDGAPARYTGGAWVPIAAEGEWVQPLTADAAYPTGAQVTHGGKTWESTIDANVWAPGVSGWEEV